MKFVVNYLKSCTAPDKCFTLVESLNTAGKSFARSCRLDFLSTDPHDDSTQYSVALFTVAFVLGLSTVMVKECLFAETSTFPFCFLILSLLQVRFTDSYCQISLQIMINLHINNQGKDKHQYEQPVLELHSLNFSNCIMNPPLPGPCQRQKNRCKITNHIIIRA